MPANSHGTFDHQGSHRQLTDAIGRWPGWAVDRLRQLDQGYMRYDEAGDYVEEVSDLQAMLRDINNQRRDSDGQSEMGVGVGQQSLERESDPIILENRQLSKDLTEVTRQLYAARLELAALRRRFTEFERGSAQDIGGSPEREGFGEGVWEDQ